MGFRAYVIVWDWEKKSEKLRHELHKVSVQIMYPTSKVNVIILYNRCELSLSVLRAMKRV